MENTLIIFIKNPILGKVKSRLASTIGEKDALNLYCDLLERTRKETKKVKAKRMLFYSTFIDKTDQWDESHFVKQLQSGKDLGQRMCNAFEEVSQQKTIIIGSDCYDITAALIEDAFLALDKHDVVLGPANDGGYYLLGTNNHYPCFFENIDWSTEKVLQQTLNCANRQNLSVFFLKELVDLDTFSDIEKSSYKFKRKF